MSKLIILTLGVILLPFSLGIALGQTTSKSFECVLIGEVMDRPESKVLLLFKEKADFRFTSDSISIEQGKFSHVFTADALESYTLAFIDEIANGAFRPINIFAEADTIYLRLYPMDRGHENEIQGGVLNQDFIRYKRQIDQLFELPLLEKQENDLIDNNLYYTAETYKLIEEMETTDQKSVRDSIEQLLEQRDEDRSMYTPEANTIEQLYQERYKEMIQWKAEQIQAEPSLINYREMIQLLSMAAHAQYYRDPLPIAVPDLLNSFEKIYAPKYPGHPYTQQVRVRAESFNTIKTGGKYIDFTAPAFDGTSVTLSKHIGGKIAFINLWASWCGPCRKKGIEMIPVYEAYKDKGFVVVGIARERDAQAAVQAAKKDRYPWLNLLEINDSQQIWQRYGVGNAGGGTFLVDENGVLLAISPTADEVRKILEERIGRD